MSALLGQPATTPLSLFACLATVIHKVVVGSRTLFDSQSRINAISRLPIDRLRTERSQKYSSAISGRDPDGSRVRGRQVCDCVLCREARAGVDLWRRCVAGRRADLGQLHLADHPDRRRGYACLSGPIVATDDARRGEWAGRLRQGSRASLVRHRRFDPCRRRDGSGVESGAVIAVPTTMGNSRTGRACRSRYCRTS